MSFPKFHVLTISYALSTVETTAWIVIIGAEKEIGVRVGTACIWTRLREKAAQGPSAVLNDIEFCQLINSKNQA